MEKENPPKFVPQKEEKPVIEPEKGNVRLKEDVEEEVKKNLETEEWREQP